MSHNQPILWIAFYGLVAAALFPAISFYKHTVLGIWFLFCLGFVYIIPLLLLGVVARIDEAWACRFFVWHFIACVCMLLSALLALGAHWL
jgi:hypothetical protein